ncbi:hypothetical protein HK101_006128 [Irineochytrium annulatum]|nr:hypothetical protein HK101_006128 [Irineochytrium annulatum]
MREAEREREAEELRRAATADLAGIRNISDPPAGEGRWKGREVEDEEVEDGDEAVQRPRRRDGGAGAGGVKPLFNLRKGHSGEGRGKGGLREIDEPFAPVSGTTAPRSLTPAPAVTPRPFAPTTSTTPAPATSTATSARPSTAAASPRQRPGHDEDVARFAKGDKWSAGLEARRRSAEILREREEKEKMEGKEDGGKNFVKPASGGKGKEKGKGDE